jgi:hypothetical protein
MSDQPNLFGPYHAKGSDTSEAAAEMVKPSIAERQAKVLAVLRSLGPSTGEEIAHRLGWEVYRTLPRLTELKNGGKARKTAERRQNESGATATVWEAV